MIGSLARNYTEALFFAALNLQSPAETFAEIERLEDFINSQSELKSVISLPIFALVQKIAIISCLKKELKLSGIVFNFLTLLVKNSRVPLLSSIIKEYREKLNDYDKIKLVKFTSAKSLNEKDKNHLADFLGKKLNKKIEPRFEVEPFIIGGITIRYDNYELDCSIKGSVNKIVKIIKNGNL